MGFLDFLFGKNKRKDLLTTSEKAVEPLPQEDQEFREALKLGYTLDERGELQGLYLPEEDRSTHLYVIGSSGVGKSKALANWILEDIRQNRGCGVIDPHGDLIKDILSYLPLDETLNRAVLVDLTDPEYTISFNPLEKQKGVDPYTQTLELVEVFRKIWELEDSQAPRMLEIIKNVVYTLILAGGTMLDIEPLLTNSEFRREKIKTLDNESIETFFKDRFSKWTGRDQIRFVESTLNKVSTFTSDPRLRLMLGQAKSTINFREIMDSGKVILVNLSKGVLRGNSYLLGALFVSKIQMAAMSRENLPIYKRRPFYFYVDEFQDYATESFAEILSEARKYSLCLTLAHQNLEQMNKALRATILANAKNFCIFRVDRRDAEELVKYLFEADPYFIKTRSLESIKFMPLIEQWEQGIKDLVDLPLQHAVLKTKAREPTFFRTYDLPDSDWYINTLPLIRERNYQLGYTRKKREIKESLALKQKKEEPLGLAKTDNEIE